MDQAISDEIIRSLSTPQSFERGLELYHSGALFDLARQGNLLLGRCEGSSAPEYSLQAELGAGGIQAADCSCPYDWGGLCKHLVALLLAAVHSPEDFSERQPVPALLDGLDREALVRLLEKLVEKDPDLYGRLELAAVSEKAGKVKSKPARGKRKSEVDEQTYRKQVRRILNSLSGYRMSEAYWMMGGMVEELRGVEEIAQQFLEAGEAEGAITILIAILEETTEAFGQFDDSDGELGYFLRELGLPLSEAILSAGLSEEERTALKERLEPVLQELNSYGINETEVALTALEEGWEGLEIEEDLTGWGFDLTEAKLNVLERQGRLEEYLDLCLGAGEHRRYALKLLEIGRGGEALAFALKQVSDVGDALAIALRLAEMGELQGALRVGERGLGLSGSKRALGTWLGPLEEAQGHKKEALQAYRAAFDDSPSLQLYRAIKRLVGPNWERVKSELFANLKGTASTEVLVDVYLEEQKWDDAIKLAEQKTGDYRLVEKVAEAVLPHRPEWVIRVSIGQSDELIERTQSKYYPHAARWLQLAKRAYLQLGKETEWQNYLTALKAKYARRPALQEELRRL